jgi:RHS repeat-associated protein
MKQSVNGPVPFSYPFGWPTFLDGEMSGMSISDVANEIQFTGQQFDVPSQLLLFRRRWYHATMGVFASRDTYTARLVDVTFDEESFFSYIAHVRASEHTQMNLYASWFVPNYTDPQGESPTWFGGGRRRYPFPYNCRREITNPFQSTSNNQFQVVVRVLQGPGATQRPVIIPVKEGLKRDGYSGYSYTYGALSGQVIELELQMYNNSTGQWNIIKRTVQTID